MNLAAKVIKDICTEQDGESYDVARIGIFAGVVILCLCTVYALVRVEKVILTDVASLLQNFGISLAAVVGGGSAGVAAKAKTEAQ